MLDDVERIEVTSGPGGTLWGANAVNGVINIITRHSLDTQGGLAVATGGDLERDLTIRYGGQIGTLATYRAYVQGFDRSRTLGGPADAWNGLQAGFRVDGQTGSNTFTLQGDAYRNRAQYDYTYLSGFNVVGRWTRDFQSGASLTAQAYIDRAYRWAPFANDRVNTYDAQVQYSLAPGARHQIVLGGGYRYMQDRFLTDGFFFLDPPERDVSLGNVFIQDDIALRRDLKLTLGFKVEDSSFTGLEYLPNVRLAWDTGRTGLLWGAVSRSVRTPSTIERDLTAVGFVEPARNFQSESLIAFEAGYRVQPTAKTALSVSTYYNLYDKIRTLGLALDPAYLFILSNDIEGHTYGLEAWADYTPTDWWRLSAGVNLLQKDLHVKDGRIDISGLVYGGDDPGAQAFLRSQMNIRPNVEMDLAVRAVEQLALTNTPGYVEADARLAWRLRNDLELSVVGRNLLDAAHPEIVPGGGPVFEIKRSIYFTVRAGF
ncbi:MAG: TonB-dependent receptor plug domain-containing protein [Caulobacteraceae bacterium]